MKINRINRGDIFLARLDEYSIGSEQTGIRPVVILQNDMGNKYSTTTIVAPITSKTTKAELPTHVYIENSVTRLPKDSLILAEQIKTIDKMRLQDYFGVLDSKDMKKLDNALLISLGIKLKKSTNNQLFNKEEKAERREYITRKQVASYGMVAREYLKNTGNLDFTNEEFGEYILALMDLYTPVEVEEQANSIKNKK